MMNARFIKMYHTIWDKGWSKKPHLVSLWVYLLCKATHKQIEYLWNGQTIKLQSGQLITGRKALSEATGINESTIERALSYFEKERQIEQRKTSTSRLITITNWSKWQQSEQRMNNQWTTNEQPLNTKQERIDNIDIIYSQDCLKFVDFVNQTFSKKFRCGDKIVTHFKARITKDKVTKQELFDVIKALKESQYHIDTNFKYCTPEFILRLTTIEKYKHGSINKTTTPTNQPNSNPNLMDDFYGD